MNVLISSAGRRVSLVRFFKTEIQKAFPGSKVIASDAKPELSAACREADEFFAVPRVTANGYIDQLLGECIGRYIKLVIPRIDT